MKFKGLSIQGFRSFVGDHVFHFPATSGVYFVGGDNQAEPELSPNGCGKSSLWDALVWTLYGQTTRKQKAQAVSNWDDEYATVCALDLEIRGMPYSITRAWNPNALTLQRGKEDPKAVTQDDVDKLIGLNFERFCATVVMSQFGSHFLSLGAAAKLASFSRVLGLDYWLEVSERAKQDEERLVLEANRLRQWESQLLAGLEHDRQTWHAAKAAADDWAAEHERNVSMAMTHLRNTKESAKQVDDDYARLEDEQAEHAEWIREAEQESDKRKRRIDRLKETIQEREDKGAALDDRIGRQLDTKESIDAMVGRCPTCRQRVSNKHAASVLEAVNRAVAKLTPELNLIDEDLKRLNDQVRTLSREHAEKESGLQSQRNKLHRFAIDMARLKDQQTYSQRAVALAEQNLEDTKLLQNPHQVVIQDLLQRMHQADQNLEQVQTDLTNAERQRSLAAYWKQEFKNVRLWVCQQAMAEFSAIMGAAIEQLGLHGWEVRAELERPTKKGTVQRGFQCFIKSPKSPDWVPFESWCGGETQRLLLGGDVAFAELETSRSGLHISAEVWDEPTQHLSQGGVQSLVEYLNTRARRTGKTIFMVDHHVVESGQFAGTYTIVKDQDGSRIVNNFPQRLDYAQPEEDDGRFKRNKVPVRRRVPE